MKGQGAEISVLSRRRRTEPSQCIKTNGLVVKRCFKKAKKHGLRSEEERRGKEGKPQPTVHFLLLPLLTFHKGLRRKGEKRI
jgi:hypothetical protein